MTLPSLRSTMTVLVALAVASAVAACSASRTPTPSDETGASAQDLEFREETLAALAEAYSLEDPPTIEPIQWYGPTDQGPALAQCLTDAGFSAKATNDGYLAEYSSEQERAYSEAKYACEAKYPLRAPSNDPPPEEYVRGLYEYRSEVLVDCFAEHGYVIDEAPSWEKFRDDTYAGKGQWNPWSTLYEQPSLAREEIAELEVACVPRQALWQGPLVAGGDLLKESDDHVQSAGVPGRGEGPGRPVDLGR